VPTSGLTFTAKEVTTGVSVPVGSTTTYVGGGLWSLDLQPGKNAGYFNINSGEARIIYVVWPYGEPYGNDESATTWLPHIATNKGNATLEYLVDVSDILQWPVEFINSVAADLAFQASITHAKSPRLIQILQQKAAMAFSEAVSSLSSDDTVIVGGQRSAAIRARF